MESRRSSTTYFIPPGKFLLMENALGNPDLIQSSVSSDCRVTIVDLANFPLDELEQWPTFRLTSADIKLKLGNGAYYVYIVVPTPENMESTVAFISYNTALVDRDGYQVLESTDEKGNPKLEKGELLGKSGFKYYQCGTVSARGGNSSAITTPSGQGRTLTIDLGVNPQDSHLDKKVDWNFFYSLFVPHYDDPDDPKKLTWIEAKAHMGIAGGLTSFIDNGSLKLPSIYDGLPIDYQTLYWDEIKEEVGTDEEGNPIYKTTKVLKAKSLGEGGEGGSTGGGLSVTEIKTLIESYGYLTESKLPIASNSVKGIASFNSEQFSVVDGVVSFIGSTNNTPDLSEYVTKDEFAPVNESYYLLSTIVGQHTDYIKDIKENYATQDWVSKYFATSDQLSTVDAKISAKWTTDTQKISNWDTAFSWGNHATAGYVEENTLAATLNKYVDLDNEQVITGKKNFANGLLVKGKEIEYIQTDNSKGYWKLEGDLIVSGGITSFANSSGFTPSTIMDGIVCDEQTITIEDVSGVKMLKVIGGSGGTGVNLTVPEPSGDGNAVTSISYDSSTGVLSVEKGEKFVRMIVYQELVGRVDDLEDDIASGGGTIDLSSYALMTWVDENFASNDWVSSNFASLKGNNTFSGTNKFNGQLFVNNKEIKYNPKGYWELEGDLLVTGGITSFANSSGFKPSTIMDGIVCDEQTITVDVINGVKTLKVIGGGSGTIHWDDIEDAPTSLKNPYALVINGTTYDGSKNVEINISGGSNNTQSIYPLIIKDSSGAEQLTYDPSSKQETLALTKSMVGLGNVDNTSLSSWKGSNKITTVGTITSGTWQGSEITNDYLAYDYIKIAGQKVSLGESITSATLKTELDIVTLSDEQNINGKKHFNGGLTIGGGEIEYNEDGYWKLTGNLLVTGGITSYASDGKATPFLINVDTWESILSESTTQVYSANAVTLLKNEVQSVGMDADSALAKLAIIAEELSSLTTSSYTADIRTALMNIATNIK